MYPVEYNQTYCEFCLGISNKDEMVSKEDFNKIWKDSTKEEILNQFYYEHYDLRKLLYVIDELEKWLEEQSKLDYGTYDRFEETLDKLKELKEGK